MAQKISTNRWLDKKLRARFPSTSMLTYNPFFKAAVWIPSALYSRTTRWYRNLPPNHLRIRTGVGNEIFFNHARYLMVARDFWMGALANGWIDMQSNIVDLGVGCGRYAHHLRDFRFYGQKYEGTYIGVDIDDELLQWCRDHFDAERFRFILSDHQSTSYRSDGSGDRTVRLDIESETQDLIYSRSLFSHLLEAEFQNYVEESYRMLKPGGRMAMTYFSMTTPPKTYGTRHNFKHQVGLANCEDEKQLTAAVAYHDDDLRSLIAAAGFQDVTFTSVPTMIQQMFVAVKPG